MKQCGVCGTEKPLSQFDRKGTGWQYKCKDCRREYGRRWYQQNRRTHKKNVAVRKKTVKDEVIRYVFRYLQENPCVDCGETDPIVLEFDHRNPDEKSGEIANLRSSGYNLDTVVSEIEKCDVRCANCHRRRTARQQGWYKDYTSVAQFG